MPAPAVPSRAVMRQTVDEFGALSSELDALRPKRDRHDQLRRQIAGWFDGEDAAQSFTVEGNRYTVEVSPRQNRRSLRSMPALMKRLGQKLFLQLCSFPLEVLDRHVPLAEQGKLVNQDRIGPRSVTATLKFVNSA